MSDGLKLTIGVDANVQGKGDVDAMAKSFDTLGNEAQQTGTEARAAAAGVDAIGPAAKRAEAQAVPAQKKISDSAKEIGTQLKWLAGAYAAIQGGGALGNAAIDFGKVADAAKSMQARLALVVGEGPKLEAAMQGVVDVALRTSSALEATSTLVGKVAEAGKSIGVGFDEALALTETINQAIQISGASAQASEASITQLVQALQSGVLRGDEFNSIMEQAPRLAKALADGLGISTGALRAQAEAGALSSETVIKALQGQARAVDSEFGKLPQTIGRALTDLSTQWTLFIGKTDEATGASSKAAAVIETLAGNLDLVAGALINSGQAWLGWKAYNIVAEFLALRTAVLATATATGVATTATIANTAATAANTAAQAANGAAVAASGAALGRALTLLKGFSLAFLVTNLKDIGDWLAKTAYGMTDLAKRNAELERSEAGVAEAQRKMAAAAAEDAAKKSLAADAAFGLTKRSSDLVAAFDEEVKKGGAATEAIKKLAKALDLSDSKGIQDAGAALDKLAKGGKISAFELRDAWQAALSGKDLKVFEVEAAAAFDGTDQGQRRLAAAMDAVLGEAIRRTGKDMGELATGISAPAQKAINDYDTLLGRLDEIKAKGLDVGETLATSLDQAVKAATTDAAMAAVVARWEDLGKQGLVAGERLRKGLDGARDKLDELKPGINSVTEAFRSLGLKSQADLQRTADTAKAAFQTILQAGTATPAQLQQAFRRYAEAVIEANGGVASDTLRVQAAMRGLSIEVDSTGKAIIAAMGGGTRETERFGDAAERATGQVRGLKDAADRPLRLEGTVSGQIDGRPGRGTGGGFSGDINLRDSSRELTFEELRAAGKSASEISDYYSDRKTSESDKAAGLVTRSVSTQAIDYEGIARQQGFTGQGVKAFVAAFSDLLPEEMAAMQTKLRDVAVTSTEGYLTEYSGAFDRAKARAKQAAIESAARDAQATAPASVHRVEVIIGGKTTAIDTSSPDSAKGLIDLLKGLQGRAA